MIHQDKDTGILISYIRYSANSTCCDSIYYEDGLKLMATFPFRNRMNAVNLIEEDLK